MADEPHDINTVLRRHREALGRARSAHLTREPRDVPRVVPAGRPGEPLTFETRSGIGYWVLSGAPLRPGDVIEVYTNTANQWVRGRFEWSGSAEERPTLAVNLWDPWGTTDADGLPPWVGELEATIPTRAIVRRV